MRYRLHVDGKLIGDGVVDVTSYGLATFFEGNGDANSKVLATMESTRLDSMPANGINLSGFEWTGRLDKAGRKVYKRVEWWLADMK